MSKIYSRPRIRLPQIFVTKIKNNRKEEKVSLIFVVMVIAIITAKTVLDAILPVFDTLCEDRAKSIATIISNEQATVVMREHSYEELFIVEKDNNGNVVMIKSNVNPINEIISDIAVKIQNEINNQGRDKVGIALGTFTGFKLLSGKGPIIKIQISTIGNVETDLRSEFTSQGINQTLHRVYLHVKCQVSILTPFENITEDITNQVLLAENVIIGGIPDTYYNLEGIQNSDAMEVMQ